ncbi:type II toxin-antitoxin system RelE/ParE family toxin [Escherichia coli]
MEIFWTMLASQDRKRIREYIAEQNLMAAIELDERIGYSASSLAGQPYKGRNGRVEGTRELVIHPHFVRKRLVRTVLIFTESSDQLSRATDRVPGLPASPGYVQ